ncbi:MAG: TVP38/TMEM64 family protein [Pirellulaceae bacterium]
MTNDVQSSEALNQRTKLNWIRWGMLLLVLAFVGYLIWGRTGDWKHWAEQNRTWLHDVRQSPRPSQLLGAFAIYAFTTGMSIPGALPLTIIFGWLFGVVLGVIVVSFGSTTGALLAFLFSRYVFRDWVENRLGQQSQKIHEAFERDGVFYLLSLRLMPYVPFTVINLGMGLTRIRPWTYWWVSQLGMLPATIVYVLVGANLPDLDSILNGEWSKLLSWRLTVALFLLALMPILTRWIVARFRLEKEIH